MFLIVIQKPIAGNPLQPLSQELGQESYGLVIAHPAQPCVLHEVSGLSFRRVVFLENRAVKKGPPFLGQGITPTPSTITEGVFCHAWQSEVSTSAGMLSLMI